MQENKRFIFDFLLIYLYPPFSLSGGWLPVKAVPVWVSPSSPFDPFSSITLLGERLHEIFFLIFSRRQRVGAIKKRISLIRFSSSLARARDIYIYIIIYNREKIKIE